MADERTPPAPPPPRAEPSRSEPTCLVPVPGQQGIFVDPDTLICYAVSVRLRPVTEPEPAQSESFTTDSRVRGTQTFHPTPLSLVMEERDALERENVTLRRHRDDAFAALTALRAGASLTVRDHYVAAAISGLCANGGTLHRDVASVADDIAEHALALRPKDP